MGYYKHNYKKRKIYQEQTETIKGVKKEICPPVVISIAIITYGVKNSDVVNADFLIYAPVPLVELILQIEK